jgi:hypothetical protein
LSMTAGGIEPDLNKLEKPQEKRLDTGQTE